MSIGPDVANKEIALTVAPSMSAVGRAEWNSLANPCGAPYDPFLDWDFLDALEVSGSVRPESGWAPRHVLARDADGALVGAMPLYVKSHSMGEFVFDHAWADAFERAGGRYYPKLLSAVPFTPVTGRRLLAAPGPGGEEIREILILLAKSLTASGGLSSCHINFVLPSERAIMERLGLLLRSDRQFHWRNRGYASFDDFLCGLSSRKRKNIRKERSVAQEAVTFGHLTGSDLTASVWDVFYKFYIDTNARKWGMASVTPEFFHLLGERMSEKILLVMAFRGGEPIAAALSLVGSEALYGRYWGCSEGKRFLHFEVCYYQAIDYAIAHGLQRVEGGAQGEHKLARGYEPQCTWSAHWIAHTGLRDAVAGHLGPERQYMADQIRELQQHAPFRRIDETGSEVQE